MKKQLDIYKPNWHRYYWARYNFILRGMHFSFQCQEILQRLIPEPEIINLKQKLI